MIENYLPKMSRFDIAEDRFKFAWSVELWIRKTIRCCVLFLCLNLIVNICSFRTILHFLKMSSVCIAAVIAQNLIEYTPLRYSLYTIPLYWCCLIHFDYLCIADALQGILHAAACFIFLWFVWTLLYILYISICITLIL